MKLMQRLGYYLGGFSVGLIILAFFLSGKKTSCSYGPEARVLKNIHAKTLDYTPAFIKDSAAIKQVLNTGNVVFSKSNPRQTPCGTYFIEGQHNDYLYELTIQNCDSTATVLHFNHAP